MSRLRPMSKIDPVAGDVAAGRLARPPTPAQIEALRRVPGFERAWSRLVAGLIGQYRGNRVLNRILNDRGRALMGLLILDLHYNTVADGGLTAGRLKQVCVETGVCSAGRVTAMIGVLRLFGFLAEVPAPDRRVRGLAPTEKLIATHVARWRHFLEAIAILDPEARPAIGRLGESAFIAGQVGAMSSMFRQGMRMLDYAPELRAVVARDAGLMILLSIAAEARPAMGVRREPVDLTISDLARRFVVSRGHVLSVLRDAEQEGLILRGGRRGAGIVATPALLDAVDRFIAAGLLIHMASLRVAATAGGVE